MYLQKTRACFVFLFFLASAGIMLCIPDAMADNRALDVYLHTGEKEWDVVLKLGHSGSYTVGSTAPRKILLGVDNAVPDALFLKHLNKWKHSLELMPGKGGDFRLLMKLPNPVREVRSSWVAGKKLLTHRVFLKTKKWEKEAPVVPGKCTLEDLRFGVRKKFIRSVMDLTSKPLWRFSSSGTGRINIALEGVRSGLTARKVVPGKGIRQINLKTKPGELGIALQFESGQAGFRLFWLETGSRLVLDSYRVLDKTFAENTTLPLWFGRPEKPSPEKIVPVPLEKSILQEAMPEISPVILQESLVAFSKKKESASDEPAKTAPERIPDSAESAGQKVIIAIPKPQILTSRHENKGQSVEAVKYPEAPHREKKNPKFEPKEAVLYGAILRAGDLQHSNQALGLIAEFLATYPDSDVSNRLRFMKADILLSALHEGKQGILSKVVEAYQNVINRAPDSDLALKSYVKMAKAYAMSGNHYLGISCLDLAIRRYQKKQDLGSAYLERGEIYLEKNLTEKAVDDFKTVLRRYPTPELTSRALFGTARYLQARGLYKEAQERLSKIENLRPGFFMEEPDFLSVQAQNYLYLKEYAKARDYFYRAINLASRQESGDLLLMHIGDTYLQESKRKKAEKLFTLVKNTYPESEGASIAELRLGELHGDVNKFKEIRNKHPNGSIAEIATLKVANEYYKADLYQKTMENLKELAAKPPKDSMVIAARSLFTRATEGAMSDLYKKGKFSELVALFHENEALLKGKIRPDKKLLVARSLQELKNYSGAISAYRELSPADLSADKAKTYYLGLADCLSLSGFSQDSIQLLEAARKGGISFSARLAVTRALADRYNKEKRFKEAYELYAEMIQQKKGLSAGEMANTYLSMGGVLNAQGKYQEGRAALNRSIALSENRKELKGVLFSALGKLGEGYLEEKRYPDALGAFAQALRRGYEKSEPGFWNLQLGQAEAFLGLGRRSAAESVLNEVYEGRGPDQRYWDLRYRLAMEYVKAGSLQTGEKLLREVSEEGTPALQSNAQIKLGSLSLQRQLEKLSIWPQIGGQEQKHARQ
jgi:tetratricopeptide (TPR) repeat protein